jgi:hypothetical protein
MNLSEYFENSRGRSVLATADAKGTVDIAVYSKPHIIDEETVAFVMLDRLSHENLKTNNHAAFLFIEDGQKYNGKRLFLTKTGEDSDEETIKKFSRRKSGGINDDGNKKRFLVYFHIDRILPLIGDKE